MLSFVSFSFPYLGAVDPGVGSDLALPWMLLNPLDTPDDPVVFCEADIPYDGVHAGPDRPTNGVEVTCEDRP